MAGRGGEAEAALLAAAVFEKLKDLKCPSLEGLYVTEPNSIQNLLCSPSVYRFQILEWMFARVYPPFRESSNLKEFQSEMKMKEMVKLGYDLMLCQSDDLDLIKGNGSALKQLTFMDQLLDAIKSLDNMAGPEARNASSSRVENFQDYAKKNEAFLTELFSSPHLQAALDPEINPWPLDIMPLLADEKTLHKRTYLSAKSSENMVEELSKMLKATTEGLEKLKEECCFLNGEAADTHNDSGNTVVQTLKVVLSDFHHLVTAFTQVYENELREHCSRPAPEINPSGPLFQSVHQTLTLCHQELKAIAEVSDTSKKIMETVERQQHERRCWDCSHMVTLSTKMEELRRKHELFHDTLQKLTAQKGE
ncbi:HAUS augmin-like complex subunit 7 [Tachyglossus aculeatus]|uniref:HAUS augmin-like complex subunit 7 n=1 Tax=Tachyglossus aculeatus TaxID=9261 RepID=UPI0018F74CE2|nr:HAUS augmin-like complex subunit 7 [Tachyglossus aculeatus]